MLVCPAHKDATNTSSEKLEEPLFSALSPGHRRHGKCRPSAVYGRKVGGPERSFFRNIEYLSIFHQLPNCTFRNQIMIFLSAVVRICWCLLRDTGMLGVP